MKLTVSLMAALYLVVASAALAHGTAQGWTKSTAERIVMRDATVRVPPLVRASLEDELLALIPRYRTLEQVAWVEGDQHAAARFHNIRYRLSTALKKVQGGLQVASAGCTGTGAAVKAKRFVHFRCAANSEEVKIPSVELVYSSEDALPTVVEGQPRTHGPYPARLFVHVTGSSSIAYRQMG